METIEIKSSKLKLILILSGLLIFIIFGILLAIDPYKFVSRIFRNIFFIRIIGIITFFFSFFLFIVFINYIFTKKFSLIINEHGLIDNSSFASVGMIEWKNITSITSTDIMSTKFLIIEVKNYNKYLQNKNTIKSGILKSNLKTYGTPIAISSNTLAYNFKELEEIILKSFAEYKKLQV